MMEANRCLYCKIFVMFSTLSYAFTSKVDVVFHNEGKQHNLSCADDEKIQIIHGSQIFDKNYSKCNYNNHTCKWLPEDSNYRFCSINDISEVSFECDGEQTCYIKSPADPDIRCCVKHQEETCENRLGYKIEYNCIPDLQKLTLGLDHREYSISGKDIVIKVPLNIKRNCSCRVRIKPSRESFTYKYYIKTNNNKYIIINEIKTVTEKTFDIPRNSSASIVVKTNTSGLASDESNLNVSCYCSYEVDSMKISTTGSFDRQINESTVDVLTSTVGFRSVVETQTKTVQIHKSEDGNNLVIIISAVGGGLVFIVVIAVIVVLLKKRSNDVKNPTINSNVSGETVAVPTNIPGTVRDDDDYNHISETRSGNSDSNQHPIVTVNDNYSHIGLADNRHQNDDDNYNHIGLVDNRHQNDDDNYNRIGNVRGSYPRVEDGNYDHIGQVKGAKAAEGKDKNNQIDSNGDKYNKEDVTYALVNKLDNSDRLEATNDVRARNDSAREKGSHSVSDKVEYAVVKKSNNRK